MVFHPTSGFRPTYVLQTQSETTALIDCLELEFHQSQVYHQALSNLQELIGEASEKVLEIVKTLGREAIAFALKSTTGLESQQFSPALPSEPSQPTTLPEREALAWKSVAQEFDQISEIVTVPRKPKVQSTKVPKKLSKTDLAEQKAIQTWEQALRQVGARLRQVRILRSLTLEQLQAQTLIPIYQLQALEEGNTQKLPEDIYVRGFIRRITAVLEIDETPLLNTIPAPNPDKIVPSWYHPVEQKESGLYLRPAHLYLGYSALMLGAVSGLSLIHQQSTPQEAYETEMPIIPAEQSEFKRQESLSSKPGLQPSKTGVRVGADMAYPETLPAF